MSGVPSPRPARAAQALILLLLLGAALALLPLHGGAWWPDAPLPARAWLAGALTAAWAAGSAILLRRAQRSANARARAEAADGGVPEAGDWLVVHASQTGQAVEFAERTAESLAAAGLRARLRPIGQLDTATLAAARRILFVASTTGEGDAPDAAAGFIRDTMGDGSRLPDLRYAVLALGDRSYQGYCAFGHALDQWLRSRGAAPMFDLVEVDNGDPAALRHWQHHLGVAAGAPELPDWAPAEYARWTLAARRETNQGSAGDPVFEIELAPPAGSAPQWRAGDIVEIGPRQPAAAVEVLLATLGRDAGEPVGDGSSTLGELLARSHLPAADEANGLDALTLASRLQPLPAREYSIASVPGEGRLRLLLRRMLRPDGSPGIGSGWLCDHAAPGGAIALRIRANPGFHGPPADVPLILIGNGTGIAGLRAHLAERIAAGGHRSWLLFGERHADRDFHQREDLLGWLQAGALERLDLAFSRDTEGSGIPVAALVEERAALHRGYVQDALRNEGERLRQWVDAGATILVCGSLQGMAPGVDATLRALLGDARVDGLLASGRYRRDVY